MELRDVEHVVKLNSLESTGCQFCGKWQEGADLEKAINHYLQEHDATLLHVGGEAMFDDHGKMGHSTVAVLATTVPPPRPSGGVRFEPMLPPKGQT